ncbi:MAG: hypothetical protein AMXMBFR13_39380 [Phycisphaerae bacterium]
MPFGPCAAPDLSQLESDGDVFATEWSSGVFLAEGRESGRRNVHCELLMIDPVAGEVDNPLPIRGECVNASAKGIYATVPIGYGLAVGQRYLFQVQLRGPDLEPRPIRQYGTIVRTELLFSDAEDRLGIGVRMAGPILSAEC